MAEKTSATKLNKENQLNKKSREQYDYSSYESDGSPVRKPSRKYKVKNEDESHGLNKIQLGTKLKEKQKRKEATESEYSSFEDSDRSPVPNPSLKNQLKKEQQTDDMDQPEDVTKRRTTRRRSRTKRAGGASRRRSRHGRRSRSRRRR